MMKVDRCRTFFGTSLAGEPFTLQLREPLPELRPAVFFGRDSILLVFVVPPLLRREICPAFAIGYGD
jgi:hypothetical protein